MSISKIPVLSDPEFEYEANKYFLDSVKYHRNLYDETDKDFNNSVLQRYSWSIIAKNNSLSMEEAKERWELLKQQYQEENNFIGALACCDDTGNDNSKIESSFPHYNAMKELLSAAEIQSTPVQIPKTKATAKKSCLIASGLKDAKSLNQRVKKKLIERAQASSSSVRPNRNELAGKVIFEELERTTPEDAAEKRCKLVQLVAQESTKNRDVVSDRNADED